MNGRIYDQNIGRFISADPNVQFPHSTQGYNRYTYVNNNPLSYTDPSGYFSLKEALGVVVGIIGAVSCGPTAGLGCALASGAITGAVGGYLATGSLQGALQGAALGMAAAGIAHQIGSHYQTLADGGSLTTGQFIGKATLHGLSQGALSVAGGGRFGDGFLGGFAGSMAGPLVEGIDPGTASGRALRVVTSAVIGGTVSRIGGGKFANGAISAAFVQAFNDGMHYSTKDGVELNEESSKKVGMIADEYHEQTGEDLVVTSGTRSPQEQAAAMYDKLAGGDDIMKLYKNQTAAGQVRDAYAKGTAAGKTSAAVTADMAKVIETQVDSGVYLSKHLRSGAVDIRSWNMTSEQKQIFRTIATKHASSVILETTPPHWHLQF